MDRPSAWWRTVDIGHICTVRFDKVTLAIAAVGVGVAILLGTQGVVAGALFAVVTGFAASALWQLWQNWLARAAREGELEKARSRYALPAAALDGGVSQLLRPEEEVVPFRPRSELQQLVRWVAREEHVGIQLITGAGGVGKTRLARQLAYEIAGWRTQWVPAGLEGEAAGTAREVGEPVLLVVDYAETRSGLQGLLTEVVNRTDGPDMRVLLLARSAGEWWRQLIVNSEFRLREALAMVQPVALGAVSDHSNQQEIYHDALKAFARRLGVECPDVRLTLVDPDAVVLVVHAAALLEVLDHSSAAQAGSVLGSMQDAVAGLLRHEARYWQQSQAARGLRLDTDVTRRVVAAGCLLGADDETAANQVLASITDLADSAELRGRTARWLHELYPTDDGISSGEWIGSLQPDLLTEQLVVGVLGEYPELTSSLLADSPPWRVSRALTVLARAALVDPRAAGQLDQVLRADPKHLVLPALDVAVETNPNVGGMIEPLIESGELSDHFLEHVLAAIPHETLALLETAVAVSQRLADGSERGSHKRGVRLVYLSNWLSDLGRREEALTAVEEAVAIERPLAQAAPDEFLPDLAIALDNLSDRLFDLGRREEALAAVEEAVAINRALVQAAPDESLPGLASSLNSLSDRLSDSKRHEEALAASRESVAIRRALAQARPEMFQSDLAYSLKTQAGHLADHGRIEEALAANDEAVDVFRRLTRMQPDAFWPILSSALNNQANYLLTLGRLSDALVAIGEAVAIRRILVRDRPEAFLPMLAMSLHNQSGILFRVDQHEDALAAISEAVTMCRQLAQTQPNVFLSELANTLNRQIKQLGELRRYREALTSIDEAVATYRQLVLVSPDEFQPQLALSLRGQSIFRLMLNGPGDALAPGDEAAALYRKLNQANPGAFRRELAESLRALAGILTDLDRESDAAAARTEAAQLGKDDDS
jgi:tetratricopeptide (TPR) repeat protein